MSIDSFLEAARALLSPGGAAILFLAVIFVGLAFGIVLSFRRTAPVGLREWLTMERVNHAFDKTFGITLTPGDFKRFRAAILEEQRRVHPIDDSNALAGKDGIEARN